MSLFRTRRIDRKDIIGDVRSISSACCKLTIPPEAYLGNGQTIALACRA